MKLKWLNCQNEVPQAMGEGQFPGEGTGESISQGPLGWL